MNIDGPKGQNVYSGSGLRNGYIALSEDGT